jgi:hypothetical protein
MTIKKSTYIHTTHAGTVNKATCGLKQYSLTKKSIILEGVAEVSQIFLRDTYVLFN